MLALLAAAPAYLATDTAAARPTTAPPAERLPRPRPRPTARPARRTKAALLPAELAHILGSPSFHRSQLSAQVVRLDTGEVLFSHRPHDLLVPASNVKLITTLAALDALTPDYQFGTKLYGELDANGTVAGDLTVQGFGDPYLIPERVWYLASRLKLRGVERITGDIVVDDAYFDRSDARAIGWREDSSSRAYMAPAGALSVGFNAVMVHVLPSRVPGDDAKVLLDPQQHYFSGIDGRIATVDGGRSAVVAEPVGRRMMVSGMVERAAGPLAFWRRIEQPALFAGAVLAEGLRQANVGFAGAVRVGAAPTAGAPLLVFESPRLADLIVPLNKFSNNFMASQLALALGAERFGAPATWDKAHRALADFLSRRLGLLPGHYALNNASGLHSVNAMSASQLVALLAFARRQPGYGIEFENSLPAARSAGTLADRMHQAGDRCVVRAKTGTLAMASSLSGYAQSADGTPMAFSLLCNNYRHIEDVWAAQDEFAAALCAAALPPPAMEAEKLPVGRGASTAGKELAHGQK